jgi:hypothetical protein
MSNGPIARYSFLPWSRQGVANLVSKPDPLDASLGARVDLAVGLRLNDAHDIDLTLRLLGPGDVLGIDPRQVVRTEPRDQTKDFIPNYLPAVQFGRPDLPWLFTPAAATAQHRLRPWIVLVVVEVQDGVALTFGRSRSVPVLSIAAPAVAADELPPLDDSWAWAHIQVSGQLGESRTLERVLEREPHNVCSRLLCPRKLEPERRYIACVVPAFEAGRLAGLGIADDADTLAPAWSVDDGPASIQLPVYYHWEFSTGGPGDFEALARLLEPRIVPKTVGMRPMDIGLPGFGMPDAPPDSPGRILRLEGALRAPTAERSDWPDVTRVPFQDALRTLLDAPATATPEEEPGPLIAPPLYGRWHAAQTVVPEDEPRWFRELNLDPRERAVAGFGTLVVQDQQENLMQSAWEQVDDVLAANRLLVRAQLARSLNASILRRDLEPLATGTLLELTTPLHTRLRMSPFTLHRSLEESQIPLAAASPAFRRVARPRGSLARRTGAGERQGVPPILERINAGDVAAAPPRSKPDGTGTPADAADAVAGDGLPGGLAALLRPLALLLFVVAILAVVLAVIGAILGAAGLASGAVVLAGALVVAAIRARRASDRQSTAETLENARFTPDEIEAVPQRPRFRLLDEQETPSDPAAAAILMTGVDSAAARSFRQAATAFHASIERTAELSAVPERPALDLTAVRTTMIARIDPDLTVPARMAERVRVPPGLWTPADPIEPIMVYPRFERPMYEALRDVSHELLLPGLEAVSPNTVTLLETNPRFIEAYMVGLNHEMARELLWREYPTDQRGSYFRQFWDVRGRIPPPRTPTEREALRDIPEIHRWLARNGLGSNMTGGSIEGRLVLLVRGELLRRFPTAVVYAARAEFEIVDGRVTRGRVPTDEERYPLFRGTLDPDVTFVGFDLEEDEARGDPEPENGRPGWFVVIQQQPTEPRFGLDVAVEFADTLSPLDTWDNLSWGHLAADAEAFAAMTHIRLGGTLPRIGPQIEPPGVRWGVNAAQQAFITLQKPVRVAIHADDMLPVESNGGS